MRTWLTIAAAGILAVANQGAAQSAEITVLSGMGSYSGVRDLAAAFSKVTGQKVNAVFETQLNQKLLTNAPADVVAAGPDQMKAKTKLTGGGPVAEYVAKGDFEIGIQQNNVLVGVPGSDFVGALPASIDKPCPFSIGMLKISTQPILARAFIAYAVSKDSAPVLRQSHLEPVTVTH